MIPFQTSIFDGRATDLGGVLRYWSPLHGMIYSRLTTTQSFEPDANRCWNWTLQPNRCGRQKRMVSGVIP